jgi:hypothetical protein
LPSAGSFLFGKGLGDLDIGYLRPIAVTGYAAYQAADSRPRPDLALGGLTVQTLLSRELTHAVGGAAT